MALDRPALSRNPGGIALSALPPPVTAHVGGGVRHLWKTHIKPKTDARYHTKAQSDTRYLNDGVGNDDFTCQANEVCHVSRSCPPGQIALNGGFTGVDPGSQVVTSQHFSQGWEAAVANDATVDHFMVTVNCIDP